MIVSVCIPTIDGRQEHLARTIAQFERLTPAFAANEKVELEWIIEVNHSNCGVGWNLGAKRATGDLLLMCADDLEPESKQWLHAAADVVLRQDGVPLGFVREDGIGRFGRDFCRVPFCRREWWLDVAEIHYWSDNHFTDLMVRSGYPPIVAEGFDFYHRRSMAGRDESPPRLHHDLEVYRRVSKA